LKKNTSNIVDENELIEKSKQGDKKALAQLVKLHEQTVYNFAFRICRDKEKAEHVMQETFLSLVKSISQFGGKSKLSTWLYTVVSNHCLMLARYEKKRYATEFEEETSYEGSVSTDNWKLTPDDVVENNELKNMLDKVINRLPEDYKIVFILRDVEGLSTRETAEALGISEGAVKVRLSRARERLRRLVSAYFGRHERPAGKGNP